MNVYSVIVVLSLLLTPFPFVSGIDDDCGDDASVCEFYDTIGWDASFKSWE